MAEALRGRGQHRRVLHPHFGRGAYCRRPTHAPREIEFENHDDIFSIIARMENRQLFAEPGQAAEFAIGLKLFSEVMLKNRTLPLFAIFRPAFSEFMRQLKRSTPTPEQSAQAPTEA